LGLSSAGAGGLTGGLEVLIVSTSKGGFLGGGFTDVNIELAMDINTAVYGPDFDVKETLARTENELPEFGEMRKILTESVHASWWEGRRRSRSKSLANAGQPRRTQALDQPSRK
jgi:hypothetical protein